MVKNLFANAEDLRDWGLISGWVRSLEKGVATHSSILAWRISCTEELGRLQSRVSKSWTQLKQLGTHTC